jgi:hypothetical protein
MLYEHLVSSEMKSFAALLDEAEEFVTHRYWNNISVHHFLKAVLSGPVILYPDSP